MSSVIPASVKEKKKKRKKKKPSCYHLLILLGQASYSEYLHKHLFFCADLADLYLFATVDMFVTDKHHELPGPHVRSFALFLDTVPHKSGYGFSEVTLFIRKSQFFEIIPAGKKVQLFIN